MGYDDNFLDDLMGEFMPSGDSLGKGREDSADKETRDNETPNSDTGLEKDIVAGNGASESGKRAGLLSGLGVPKDDEREVREEGGGDSGVVSRGLPVLDNWYNSNEEIGEDESDGDDFDGLLGGLLGGYEDKSNESEGIFDKSEKVSSEEEDCKGSEESDIIVPLETEESREVKVTSDGRSLADMIISLSGGNKKTVDIVNEVRQESKGIEVGDKKYSDKRYTKHIEVIDKETEEQKKRSKLSKQFIQRNAKFTEEEKTIMQNLGIANEQLVKIMKSKELTRKQKEEIIGLGRYGAEKHFKGKKYRTTIGDMAMLEYLVKFKFANTRILRWISNEPQGRTWRKLNRLRDNGLVESQTLIGIPDLWGATQSGVGIAGYNLNPGLKPAPKMITVSSSLGINYIAACLWFNTVNVLNLPDFPAENKTIALQSNGVERVRGENLVSELEIRSSLGKEINPQSTTMRALGDERLYDVISSNVREEFESWDRRGRAGESPEFLLGNEYMWVLYPTSELTLSYHVPDLVVRRERGPNGEPRSIAVEMERYEKSNDKYDKIMLAYKLDEYLYEKVVWVTPNARVARALERAAKAVGFTKYAIVPIITEDGIYAKQDIWLI